MSSSKDMREISRIRWTTTSDALEYINGGSLMRIADAVEKVAQRHTELMSERDQFKKSMEFWRDQCDGRDKTISNLKGQITKLKKARTA